ncbi:MAG: hypothetical protein AAFV43_14230 [Planctomycetota bacterium]
MVNQPGAARVSSLCLAACCAWAGAASAQTADELIDGPPFDTIVLENGTDLRVRPLDAPRRNAFRKPTTGDIVVKPIASPDQSLRVEWDAVARVRWFEDVLLSASQEAIDADDFDAAYLLLQRLEASQPRWPGLAPGFERLLREEALARFRAGETAHSLALLGALYDRAPRSRGLSGAVDAVGDAIVEKLWSEEDYRGVGGSLESLAEQFENLPLKTPAKWRERLAVKQQQLLTQASGLLDRGLPSEAREAATGAAALGPLDARGEALVRQIQQADPTVRVGVFRRAPTGDPRPRIDRPAARRVARLLGGSLARLDDYVGQGGAYSSPLGVLSAGEDRRSIRLQVAPEQLRTDPAAAHAVARTLTRVAADPPAEFAALAQLVDLVSIESAGRVTLRLRTPHLRPEALLLGAAPESITRLTTTDWTRDEAGDGATRLVCEDSTVALRRVEEIAYEDDGRAIAALARGDIQLLADAPLWSLPSLRKLSTVQVGRYRIPTVHCLLVGPDSRLAARRDARRAIVYATPRAYFVNDLLLAGKRMTGVQVLSASLPTGTSLNDPLRYSYTESVATRPYRPRLSALLTAVSAQIAAKDAESENLPEEPPLTLAYPNTPVARLACLTIADQFAAVGASLRLAPYDDESELTSLADYDLRYAEVRIDEPMVQAWSLLGPDGLAGDCSAALLTALEAIPTAASGEELSDRFFEVHQIANGDLQVIPLWQTVDHYAWHTSLTGVPETTVDLYQSIGRWRRGSVGSRR